MNSENILLDKVKEACSIPSDNALAAKIGVTRQTLSKVRREDLTLADERIAQLCAMAKLDGPTWLARIHAERAQSPAERALWKSALDRLSAAAAVIAFAVLAVPAVADAKTLGIQTLAQGKFANSVYYVQHP